MANRRQFIQSGAALSALALAPAATWATARATAGASPAPELFLYDTRFAEARAMAMAAQTPAGTLRGFAGDPTELWLTELDARWRAAPMALAGVTTARCLFALETLAADRRMRVTHREALDAEADGAPLMYWAIAPLPRRAAS